jgi:hypothetical protein
MIDTLCGASVARQKPTAGAVQNTGAHIAARVSEGNAQVLSPR